MAAKVLAILMRETQKMKGGGWRDFKMRRRVVSLKLVFDPVTRGSTLYVRSWLRKGRPLAFLVPALARDKIGYLESIGTDTRNGADLSSLITDVVHILHEQRICT